MMFDFSTPEAMQTSLSQCLLLVGGLLSVAAFVFFYGLFQVTTPEVSPTRKRLLALRDEQSGNHLHEGDFTIEEQLIAMREKMVNRLIPTARSLYGGNSKYLHGLSLLLAKAGLPDSEEHVFEFLGRRLFTACLGGAAGGVVGCVVGMGFIAFMFFVLFGMVLGGMLPPMALREKGKHRVGEMLRSLPDVLDLMVVCVEAGLGLDATIQRVARDGARIAPDMCKEFSRVTREMNAGLQRSEVFHNLGLRNEIDELRSLTTLVIQSDKLGSSIGDALRVYAEDMRMRRKQRAEELAAKAGIKMTLPLVFFVFPPLMIVLMGPMIIKALQSFGVL
jgi:tight adherence protein C